MLLLGPSGEHRRLDGSAGVVFAMLERPVRPDALVSAVRQWQGPGAVDIDPSDLRDALTLLVDDGLVRAEMP